MHSYFFENNQTRNCVVSFETIHTKRIQWMLLLLLLLLRRRRILIHHFLFWRPIMAVLNGTECVPIDSTRFNQESILVPSFVALVAAMHSCVMGTAMIPPLVFVMRYRLSKKPESSNAVLTTLAFLGCTNKTLVVVVLCCDDVGALFNEAAMELAASCCRCCCVSSFWMCFKSRVNKNLWHFEKVGPNAKVGTPPPIHNTSLLLGGTTTTDPWTMTEGFQPGVTTRMGVEARVSFVSVTSNVTCCNGSVSSSVLSFDTPPTQTAATASASTELRSNAAHDPPNIKGTVSLFEE
mmetsp:Transcript_29960/g.45859  ORF Transcript_29960/g.45859 Transcript_29960/m.45859 type:complete len:293 (+) Transcript_29960:88-966(+)